jgi:hypothetical protein
MNLKRRMLTSAVTLGLGLATLTAGAGMATAEPGPPCPPFGCQGPGGPGRPDFDRGGPDFDRRGPDFDRRGPDFDRPGPRWDDRHDAPPPPPPPDLAWRGIDQGRFDHQPFNYNGSWVTPIFNPDFNNWGFWLFGLWIPL